MATLELSTTQNVGIRLEGASPLHRAAAWIIDIAIFVSLLFVASLLLQFVVSEMGWYQVFEYFYFGYVLCILLYPLLTEALLEGQSLGKKVLKIRVVMLDGSRPTLGAYAIRWIIGLVELPLTTGSLAFLISLFSKHNQRLGDMVAGTTVVMVKPAITLDELLLNVNENTQSVEFPQAAVLNDSEVQIVRDVLWAQKSGMEAAKATQILHQAVENLEVKLGVKSTTLPEHFLYQVLQSYSVIHSRDQTSHDHK